MAGNAIESYNRETNKGKRSSRHTVSAFSRFTTGFACAFTGASGNSPIDMVMGESDRPGVALGGRPGQLGDRGFREEFRDNSNLQVRHYTGGVMAGLHLGTTAALAYMNSREDENRPGDRIDMALNAVSTRHGGQLNATNFTQLAAWIRSDICTP